MVPAARAAAGRAQLRPLGRPLGRRLHHGRDVDQAGEGVATVFTLARLTGFFSNIDRSAQEGSIMNDSIRLVVHPHILQASFGIDMCCMLATKD